jgi:hypothetical protein
MSTAKQTKAVPAAAITTTVVTATEDSIKQIQDLVEAVLVSTRQLADVFADAALVAVKRNQELTNQVISTFADVLTTGFDSTLAALPKVDLTKPVLTGFDFTKSILEVQRDVAERLVGAVPATPVTVSAA